MTIILNILLAILILFLAYVLFLTICSLFVDPKKEYEHNSRFYRALLHSASAGALKLLRINVHTNGLEKIPTDVKPVFVGNHRSNFDPIIEWQVLKAWQPAFISKASNFKIPLFGRFIRKCCFMAIDRENPRKAMGTIRKAAELLKKREVSIGVYPEGTRSRNCELLPFHNGVFKIAQKANAPIVVLAISGSEKIHKRAIFFRSDVYLDVLDVISAEDVQVMKTAAIGERVRAALEEGLSEKNGCSEHEKAAIC